MLKSIIQKYKSTTDLNRFLLKGGSLFLLWRVFRKWMILHGQYTHFTEVWATIYLKIARFVLTIAGFKTEVTYPERKLWLVGASDSIVVAFDCLGVNLFFIFMIFLLAYPGRIKYKSWFLPMGLLGIFFLNALRMAALTVIVAHHPDQMDLYHHFIFQAIIYLFIFTLWWWFSKLEKQKH